jgi:hypothetical protein
MPATERPEAICGVPHKNVQREALPAHLVLADMLKTLEEALNARGILQRDALDLFQPLWYLVETEKNVFLWKRGCSLIQQDEFEFWVDLPALIAKRQSQLERDDGLNPFVNHLWGLGTLTKDAKERELSYLTEFLAVVSDIQEHLCALSEVSTFVASNLHNLPNREHVVLPSPYRHCVAKSNSPEKE